MLFSTASVCCAEIWYLTFSKVKQKLGINLELRRRIFCQNWAVCGLHWDVILTSHFSQQSGGGSVELYVVFTEQDNNCVASQAVRQPGRHQRKRIVLANFGCDQTRPGGGVVCFIHQYHHCSYLQEPQSSGVQRSLVTISIPLSAVSTMSASSEALYWSPAQVSDHCSEIQILMTSALLWFYAIKTQLKAFLAFRCVFMA